MKIKLHSIFVADQDKAKTFYTEVLGFELKQDAAYGPDTRWLTVVSPEDPNGIELLLAPTKGDAGAEAFQKAQYAAEKPASSFTTDDIQKEYERLQAQGVLFRMEPKQMPYVVPTRYLRIAAAISLISIRIRRTACQALLTIPHLS